MEKLSIANKHLKTANDDREREYDAQIKKLDDEETLLTARLSELDKKKLEIAQANGNEDAADDDLVEVNAGGKVISAKRSTLTQLKGTRFEALFSGRWDKKLQRDSDGRIFLDVNPLCFQAIVDYLNEMAISSDDNPPDPPSVADELNHILKHQLELFELETVPAVSMPDSTIIQDGSHITQLHYWLKEGGDSDVEFSLLYRGSRDGLSNRAFHSKCDNQGCTLTVIQTTGDMVVGGYSNTPWNSTAGWASANKAFLFGLSGSSASGTDIFPPCKMKLRNANDTSAIYRYCNYGPIFGTGHDLHGSGSSVSLNIGQTYESDPTGQLSGSHKIKEIEVFKVIPATQKPAPKAKTKLSSIEQVANFSEKINAAINAKWASLGEADDELLKLEDSFKDEGTFTTFFSNGKPQDVVSLNVCGTIMVTRRQTLQLCKESALASKFSSDEQESQSHGHSDIKEWNHEDVVAWLNHLEISESVVKEFEDNQVTG
ncbi:hypothetical protein ACHAXR_004448, partial [Thalassiosira sp. AJA248-18]